MKEEEKDKSFLSKLVSSKKLLFFIILIVIGLVIWRMLVSRNNGEFEQATVERGKIAEELILTGEVKADKHTSLRFPYSGKISWIGVSEGEMVEEDDSLLKLDTTTLSMDQKIADANLRQKEAILDRVYDNLQGKEDTESFSERETRTIAETNKDVTVFSNIKAQYNLSLATLRAPFDGIVTSLNDPVEGKFVLFSETQVEIVDPDTIFFEVSADQSEVVEIHKGQKVKVILDSFSDEDFNGVVDFVGLTPIENEVGTLYKVKVKLVGREFDLTRVRIGMSGDAKFILEEKTDALFVPNGFVNSDSEGRFVFLGKGEDKVYVETGLESEDYTEIITEELTEGTLIHD